jgi:hypothetical protein
MMIMALPLRCDLAMKSLKSHPGIICLLTTLALYSCASFPAWLRQYTYPPDFNYIPHDQIGSAMWQLAKDVRALEKVLREPGEVDEQRRVMISSLLDSMDEKAAKLNSRGRTSNHPMLDANLPIFRRDILLARQGVEKGNYTLVALLPGACVYCHGAAH